MPGLIIIRRPKMVIALTEEEVMAILKQRPDIWTEALKRGKQARRCEKALDRREK